MQGGDEQEGIPVLIRLSGGLGINEHHNSSSRVPLFQNTNF